MVAPYDQDVPSRLSVAVGRRTPRILAAWASGMLATTFLLALLVVSPLVLALFSRFTRQDWVKIGNIGQAYGAVSAVISGIAVVGIAVSLYMQANQNQFQQIQCMRNQQLELMKLLLEDPALLAVSVTADGMSRDQWRQGIFINLLFKHLEMGYLTGYATERSVAIHVAEYFNIQFVRDWWRGIRKLYHIDASTRKRRRFARIVDTVFTRTEQEWQDAGDWLVRDRHRGLPWPRTTGQQTFAAIAAIAAIAIPLVSYGMIRRRRRR